MESKQRRAKPNASGRNVTERHIRLPHFMLGSAAWMTLSPAAKALLLAVWTRHNGTNNGEIAYSVREARSIGLTKSVAARAFAELTERGFLKVWKPSTFTLKTREARTWELTAEPCSGQAPTRDFMRWSSEAAKNKTQSPQRDAQSLQRDTSAFRAIKLPISVPPAGPSGAETTVSQSLQRDTSILPGGAQQS